ncbi:hypothetical protein OS493_010080 [Desmophyllum pertusum]|uniref:Uncharacterized protein n=1 Tax=Desmophyllum pertusum TaxID=174260 RepID=A0A9X0CG31_9CNID|nr:hypothetical protein OS493_010080 [Desmophyllum pertusum]
MGQQVHLELRSARHAMTVTSQLRREARHVLKCGNNTKALPNKDGCDTHGCNFTAAPGVVYDLNKLSRPGGPMIEILFHQRKVFTARTWSTLHHLAVPAFDVCQPLYL